MGLAAARAAATAPGLRLFVLGALGGWQALVGSKVRRVWCRGALFFSSISEELDVRPGSEGNNK